MTDMSSRFAVMYFSQVEALWVIVTCVLKSYGTPFRGGDVGPALDTDVLQSAQVNFGNTSGPRGEIPRRVQATGGKLEVRNGRLLHIRSAHRCLLWLKEYTCKHTYPPMWSWDV